MMIWSKRGASNECYTLSFLFVLFMVVTNLRPTYCFKKCFIVSDLFQNICLGNIVAKVFPSLINYVLPKLHVGTYFLFNPVVVNRVNLLSYKEKTTIKREQYNWMAEKN